MTPSQVNALKAFIRRIEDQTSRIQVFGEMISILSAQETVTRNWDHIAVLSEILGEHCENIYEATASFDLE